MSDKFIKEIEDYREKWGINENLLQLYRQIFIGSQSFLLAVGAILSSKTNHFYLILIAFISILSIWLIWFPVVRARHLAVDYHKYIYMFYKDDVHDESKKTGLSDLILKEKEYINVGLFNWKLRLGTNRMIGIPKNFRPTRVRMDLVLPIMYSLFWILIILNKYFPKLLYQYFT